MTLRMFTPARWTAPVLAAFSITLFVAVFLGLYATGAGAVTHGAVVSEDPRRDVPVVLDGAVHAHAQLGDLIFVGGEFQQVRRPDGTVITQPNLFAYSATSGALIESFRPAVDRRVRAMEAAPDGSGVYVGGQFNTWDGVYVGKIAKIRPDGSLNTSFAATASAQVLAIAARADKVFLAGDFTSVRGETRVGFAAVSASNGAVDSGFVMDAGLPVAAPNLARGVVLTSDGNTLFGMHFGRTINGEVREAVFKADVSGSTATLTGWRVDWSGQQGDRECLDSLRDMAIDPGDAFIVIGGQGADNPPNCDSVLNFPVAGNSTVTYNWVARMYSSVFSLAVSDSAVYVGGHFCAAPKNPIPQGGISSDWTGKANSCNVNDPFDRSNPSVLDPDNAVFRKQIAALNPDHGQALPWDPGSNNFVAVYDLAVVDAGLLAGHDRDRFNDVLTGRSGLFPVGDGGDGGGDGGVGEDTTAPVVNIGFPGNGATLETVTGVSGFASDNEAVSSVEIQLANTSNNTWLQPDGTFASTPADVPATLAADGSWSVSVQSLADGQWALSVTATDTSGNTATTNSTFTVEPKIVFSCTVELNGGDQPVVTWVGVNGVNRYTVLRDGINQTTVRATSWTDTDAAPGTYVYAVRFKLDGANQTTLCDPALITVPGDDGGDGGGDGGGGPIPPCVVELADGGVLVSWTAVDGASSYQVWDQDGSVAQVNSTSFLHADAPTGARSYFIKYGKGKNRGEISCSPDPIIVQ